jgi:hypothetical protein
MTESTSQSSTPESRDAAYWAQLATNTLTVRDVPPGAINLNVEGHAVYGPLQGFGTLWRKTFRVRLAPEEQLSPSEVMRVWKADFGQFWPKGQRFYASTAGIVPGEVALINGLVGGLPMDTGMLVLYADDSCFTLMTPRGHVFSSWITFSSELEEQDTYAQVQMLLRAGDPIFAAIMRLGGFRFEDGMWHRTLRNLAAHFDSEGEVEQENVCLDPRLQWR